MSTRRAATPGPGTSAPLRQRLGWLGETSSSSAVARLPSTLTTKSARRSADHCVGRATSGRPVATAVAVAEAPTLRLRLDPVAMAPSYPTEPLGDGTASVG